MLRKVNQAYLQELKGRLKWMLEKNPPETHDAIRKMCEKHIAEVERILDEQQQRKL
jgi:hypothetical protein